MQYREKCDVKFGQKSSFVQEDSRSGWCLMGWRSRFPWHLNGLLWTQDGGLKAC